MSELTLPLSGSQPWPGSPSISRTKSQPFSIQSSTGQKKYNARYTCTFLKNKFIYFWLHWVFIAARGLSLTAGSGSYSSLWCTGFSLRWLLLLRSMGSRCLGFSSCGSRALERRLSSCGARALLLRSMWDLPGPGLEPMSPALAGGFLTTVPGKSPHAVLNFLVATIF